MTIRGKEIHLRVHLKPALGTFRSTMTMRYSHLAPGAGDAIRVLDRSATSLLDERLDDKGHQLPG